MLPIAFSPVAATLGAYGWQVWRSAAPAHADPIPEQPPAGVGRVVRIDRGVYTVVTDDGAVAASLAGELKDAGDPVARPAIGDWVVLAGSGDAVIGRVLPRRSMFVRGDIARMQAQVVAANVDVVFVVHPASGEPNLRRLERELVLAFQSGAQPVVVLSKADLAAGAARAADAIRPSSVGLDVVVTSAVTREGVDALESYGAHGQTMAFIGASGVGKSTLVNVLLGADVQETAPIREADGKGRHTTTARELFLLPHGGVLVDTPGLRSLGMWRSDEGIAAAFADIEELAWACRFSNCTHDHEPGCAVIGAVGQGRLDADRVRNHRHLQLELDRLDAEAEARGRVVKQQERAARAKTARERAAGPMTHPRIGIFGGTFDPPHNGHVAAAAHARHQLGLEQVSMVVAADPWQKRGQVGADAAARFEMVQLACAGAEGLVASDVELGRTGPTYTIDTVEGLRTPGTEVVLILGADAVAKLDTWHRAGDLAALVTIAALARWSPAGVRIGVGPPSDRWSVIQLDMPRLDIESTALRAACAGGAPIDGLVPPAVVRYVREHRLYTRT